MAAPTTLKRLGTTPPPLEYLGAIWRRREFALAIAVGEVRGQHMDTALGNLWHVLNPLLLMGVYYLIFGVVLEVDRGIENYLAFLAIGVFLYHFTQRSVMAGAKSVLRNQGLIRSIQFPRAVLPISTVVSHSITMIPAIVLMLAIAVGSGVLPKPSWLLLPPVLVVQALFNVGLALVLGRLADRFPDLLNVLPYVFRLLFYLSGVLFLAERYTGGRPWLQVLFDANPLYALITSARELLLAGRVDGVLLAVAAVWALVVACAGFLFFRAGEHEYGRG